MASFHKGPRERSYREIRKCLILSLVFSSSIFTELNPIEKFLGWLKRRDIYAKVDKTFPADLPRDPPMGSEATRLEIIQPFLSSSR
jgi:hypothetical protein